MRFLDLLPVALTANAFLVPAEIKENVDIIKQIPSSAKNEQVDIECVGGCPHITSTENGNLLIQSEGSKFSADIVVDGDKVLFNQQQIWPQNVGAPLIIKSSDDKNVGIPISTSLEYKEDEILVDSQSHMTVHPISIEILAALDQVVHAESVEIRVAETESGLGLLPSRIRAYEASPYTDSCTTVWCRVKGTIAKKFNEFRQAAAAKMNKWRGGCGGRKNGKLMNGLPIKGGPAKYGPGSTLRPHGGFKGHHDGHHHGHHHGHHRGGILRHLLRSFIVGAVIGSFIGIFCFIIVSAFRRFRSGYNVVHVIEPVEIEEGHADGPPKYEEVYREPQVASEDEKKELLQ